VAASLVGLILLTIATPLFAISDQAFVRDVSLVLSAIVLGLAASDASEKLSFVLQRMKIFWLAAIVVMAWLAFQLVPLPTSLANPLWSAASLALDEQSGAAHVTIDPTATLGSLITYLSLVSLVMSAAIVGRDRSHARALMVALSFACTGVAILLLLDQFDPAIGLPAPDDMRGRIMAAIAVMAVLANGSLLIMVAGKDEGIGPSTRLSLAALAFIGIAISFLALKTAASLASTLAALGGLTIQAFIPLVRRLKLRSWQAFILFLTLAAITICLVDLKYLSLSDLAAQASPEDRLDVQRALSDAPGLGTGAGTFAYVMPMYRGFGLPPLIIAPTTAIAMSIEWGSYAFWALTAFAVMLCLALFWGALRRGHDAYLPSFAAAVVLVTLNQAFRDPSLLGPATQVTLAIALGLGLL
jgi:hypothetical protein